MTAQLVVVLHRDIKTVIADWHVPPDVEPRFQELIMLGDLQV